MTLGINKFQLLFIEVPFLFKNVDGKWIFRKKTRVYLKNVFMFKD
jgi:hypothetical protein